MVNKLYILDMYSMIDGYVYGLNSPIGTRIKKVNVLRAYYAYGYGRTTLTATGVLRLRLRAYNAYGYGLLLRIRNILRDWRIGYQGGMMATLPHCSMKVGRSKTA